MKKKCCDKTMTNSEAMNLLTENGLNRTKTKINVVTALSKAQTPISVSDIHQIIGVDNCDISTIFRTMGQFKDKGLVREINLGEDFSRFELTGGHDHDHDHHHHHVRCRGCGEIKLIEKCDLSAIEKVVAKLGFKQVEHYLEFIGLCSKCS
jgi:Fur family ferric uptake transcriptional regulator